MKNRKFGRLIRRARMSMGHRTRARIPLNINQIPYVINRILNNNPIDRSNFGIDFAEFAKDITVSSCWRINKIENGVVKDAELISTSKIMNKE